MPISVRAAALLLAGFLALEGARLDFVTRVFFVFLAAFFACVFVFLAAFFCAFFFLAAFFAIACLQPCQEGIIGPVER